MTSERARTSEQRTRERENIKWAKIEDKLGECVWGAACDRVLAAAAAWVCRAQSEKLPLDWVALVYFVCCGHREKEREKKKASELFRSRSIAIESEQNEGEEKVGAITTFTHFQCCCCRCRRRLNLLIRLQCDNKRTFCGQATFFFALFLYIYINFWVQIHIWVKKRSFFRASLRIFLAAAFFICRRLGGCYFLHTRDRCDNHEQNVTDYAYKKTASSLQSTTTLFHESCICFHTHTHKQHLIFHAKKALAQRKLSYLPNAK